MKRFENIIKNGCTLTVLVVVIFYIFALIGQFKQPMIDFGTFAIIAAFGFLIAVVNNILSYDRLKLPIRILIHYLTLLVAFSVIFILNGRLGDGNMGAIMAAIIVFTFFYGIIFLICFFAIKLIHAADKRVDSSSKKNGGKKKEKKYEPLYK